MDALVAYGSDSDEEVEENAQEIVKAEHKVERQQDERDRDAGEAQLAPPPSIQLIEPRPPRRQSEMFDDDESDDGEGEERRRAESSTGEEETEEGRELDNLLEKGLGTSKYVDPGAGGSTPGPEYTPRSMHSTDEIMENEEPENAIQHRELPPSPLGGCDPELEHRFATFFEKKEQGLDMNANIKQRKDFKNPSLYETLRDKYGIDEKGTNFSKSLYDPTAFRPDDYYDALGDYQAAQEARRKKMAHSNQEHKSTRPATFPTTSGGVQDYKQAPIGSGAQRKSRFEGK